MARPNFMCIGAPKCATTTLYEILKQHPEIFLSSFKEPHFFDIEKNYIQGTNWYLQEYFSETKNQHLVGEFTPSYLICPKVALRVYEAFGKDIKLIVILRNPIDRAYSQYLHAKRDLIEPLSFEEALIAEGDRLQAYTLNGNDVGYIRFSYMNGSKYYEHLSNWLRHFDKKNIKIILFEDFEKEEKQKQLLSEIFEFLGVSHQILNTDIKSNVASEPKYVFIKKILNNRSIRKVAKKLVKSQKTRFTINTFLQMVSNKPVQSDFLDQALKVKLTEAYFLEEIKNLEQLINKDLSHWYKEGAA